MNLCFCYVLCRVVGLVVDVRSEMCWRNGLRDMDVSICIKAYIRD